MNYLELLLILKPNKDNPDYVFDIPIDIMGSKGRTIYMDTSGHVYLSKDIGPGLDEIDITNKIINKRQIIHEVFTSLAKGVNN